MKILNDNKNILPCPFCGKEAFVFVTNIHKHYPDNWASTPHYYGVGCNTDGCFAQLEQDSSWYYAWFLSAESATDTWNKRARSIKEGR